MKHGVYHVIMAGGSGTRFWPASRVTRPKQFLELVGDRPLIRQAYERAAALSGADKVYVAAGEAHRGLVEGALPGFDPGRFIAEPCARNTAPCVGLSAMTLSRVDPDGVMVVAPADHVYTKPEVLAGALAAAVDEARSADCLVTLGIRPTRPETGYGYIEVAGDAAAEEGMVRRAARFVEKPDEATARGYLASGRFLWNSGVFIWRIGAILDAIARCAPDLKAGLDRVESALSGPGGRKAAAREFAALESISIDYAVLERADDVRVVPVDPGWSDVGSWDAVAELHEADVESAPPPAEDDRVARVRSDRCFVFHPDGGERLVALVGVEDLIVVDAGDALLICRRGDSQSVRAVVEILRSRGRNDLI